MEPHARDNLADLGKATIAALMSVWSVASAEAIIAALTIVYLLALLTEKAWKFCQWLKARRAANGCPE